MKFLGHYQQFRFSSINRSKTIYVINKRVDIGTVICPRAFVIARGQRPGANTTVTRTKKSATI